MKIVLDVNILLQSIGRTSLYRPAWVAYLNFDTAVSGDADFIVTNDAHFNEIKKLEFPSISLISGDEFIKLLRTSL